MNNKNRTTLMTCVTKWKAPINYHRHIEWTTDDSAGRETRRVRQING